MNTIDASMPRIHPTWSDIQEDYLSDHEVKEAYLAMGRSMRGDDWAPRKQPDQEGVHP